MEMNEKVEEVVDNAAEKTENAVETTADKAKEVAENVSDKAHDLAEAGKEKLAEGMEAAGEAAEKAKCFLGGLKDNIVDAAENLTKKDLDGDGKIG